MPWPPALGWLLQVQVSQELRPYLNGCRYTVLEEAGLEAPSIFLPILFIYIYTSISTNMPMSVSMSIPISGCEYVYTLCTFSAFDSLTDVSASDTIGRVGPIWPASAERFRKERLDGWWLQGQALVVTQTASALLLILRERSCSHFDCA